MAALIAYCASFGILWAIYVFATDLLSRVSDNSSAQKTAASNPIPVVGLRDEWFQVTRASFRQLTRGVTTLMDGYRQVRT